MSFSLDVKEEILKINDKSDHCRKASQLAFLCYNGQIFQDGNDFFLAFDTENFSYKRKYFTLTDKTHRIINGKELLCEEDTLRILSELNYLSSPLDPIKADFDFLDIDKSFLKKDCCKRAFLRTAFLAAGTISDPNKSYHFEISSKSEKLCENMADMFAAFDVKPKISKRKNHYILYLKEASEISTALSVLGASKSFMEFENIRIVKEMRNSVNRQVNCEAANISKTVSAAVRQLEDIQLIEDTIGLSALPANLEEMARIRLAYPDEALKNLGSYLQKPVTKSGVNHRLQKISQIADDIRSRRNETS